MAFDLAEKNKLNHPFNREARLAGCDWFYGFLKRNPTVSMRSPEGTSAARARAFNKPSVDQFFNVLENKLYTTSYKPSQIYNVDETGVFTVPSRAMKIAAKRGQKRVGIITSAERGETTTVVMCMSASGQYVPPSRGRKRKSEKSCELTTASHHDCLFQAKAQKSMKAMRKVKRELHLVNQTWEKDGHYALAANFGITNNVQNTIM
ncbi:uncharacterized protein LOC129719107 [Wyeomyia smithii]|uniref:uncharacterized protein LOC129719107 n=1 Tax=Wyeomyia smithii TaxID=174621 RepID=UPI0024681D00|nr:uncharacterized protein LOC129719107 [Wyeomyia smithii]